MRMLLRVRRGRARSLSPPELADVLYAAVWCGMPLHSPLLGDIFKDASAALSRSGMQTLTPPQLVRLAWALSAWGVRSHVALHADLLASLQSRKQLLSSTSASSRPRTRRGGRGGDVPQATAPAPHPHGGRGLQGRCRRLCRVCAGRLAPQLARSGPHRQRPR